MVSVLVNFCSCRETRYISQDLKWEVLLCAALRTRMRQEPFILVGNAGKKQGDAEWPRRHTCACTKIGLCPESEEDNWASRREIFRENKFLTPKRNSFTAMMLENLKDRTLILLMAAAFVSSLDFLPSCNTLAKHIHSYVVCSKIQIGKKPHALFKATMICCDVEARMRLLLYRIHWVRI